MDLTIRPATVADAAACADIYGYYVRHTHVSFEAEPPDAAEMARRITAYSASHAWLVAEGDPGDVVGFAYGSPYSPREAYRWAVETSVYLEAGRRRTGAGRALYEALLGRLAGRGFRRAVAGLALPNDASRGLHAALGFEEVGTLHRIGWKHGQWHDVLRLQKDLAPGLGAAPPSPV
ncbi:GNAT family N-acetyltransferase [Promicromonospora thailandica]|uniref:Phosphinothricin acetyltransferase n=1 Tax=Promicromonospora thailandica TaxID=765201 RepID=A0A9X2JXJ4_9MICO|nr:GNAT family N-acetyltransferase [Promicromonospora thailandica]MCP2264229.1 phosphinothricin acetyltransferase [Promicromonospora thailandica]BFF21094.1 GNAT family N-acetyltransferase [Promicromonospora thailandica]